MRTLVRLPELKPDSLDPVLVSNKEAGGWDKKREKPTYGEVVQAWRSQNPRPRLKPSAFSEMKEETRLQRKPVVSSNIASIGYDKTTATLEVEFSNSSVYHYFDVPESVHYELMSAPSVGSFLAANIKGHNRYARA